MRWWRRWQYAIKSGGGGDDSEAVYGEAERCSGAARSGGGRQTRVGLCPCTFLRSVPDEGDQVFPVAVIEGEVHPRREKAVFGGAGNNKANFLRQVLLTVLEDAAEISLVVAPGSEQLGRNFVVRFADYCTNKSKLLLRDLITDRWDIKEPFTD